jgi:protein involved in polysaccharide export with SLBB domain
MRSGYLHELRYKYTRNTHFKVTPSGKLRLPEIGDVPVRWSRPAAIRAVVGDRDQRRYWAVLRQLRHPRP